MSRKLRISKGLELPLELMGLATVVYGARGSGKTSFGRVLAEGVHAAGQRFCAIDLKGDWHGLKSSADGRSEGIPVVVFGGERGDLPLEESAGGFVGKVIAGSAQSSILDLELFSKGKRLRFLADFFEQLYHHNREPLLLLADEAQAYAPQITRFQVGPDASRCLGAVEDLVKLGRKHGIGPVLFTQRGSGLNKEVSELCDLLVAFRTPGPLDQDRIEDWLRANATKEQGKEVIAKLAGLPTGTAVFASGHPDLKLFGVHAVRRPETFDSSATPKVGERRREPSKLAKPDLDELRTQMAEVMQQVESDDPKALRARVAEFEARLKEAEARPAVSPDTLARLERISSGLADVRRLLDGLWRDNEVTRQGLDSLLGQLTSFAQSDPEVVHERARPAEKGSKRGDDFRPEPPARRPAASPSTSSGLGKCERALLTAFAQHGKLTLGQATIIAGYSPATSSVGVAIAKLRRLGYAEGSNAAITATPQGLKVLGPFNPLPTGSALAEFWYSQLGKCERELLKRVVRAFPRRVTLEAIALDAGYSLSTSSVGVAIAKLRKLQLVEGVNAGLIANEKLIDGGRR